MDLAPTMLGRMFAGGGWRVSLSDGLLLIVVGQDRAEIPFPAVNDLRVLDDGARCRLSIKTAGREFSLKGAGRGKAHSFANRAVAATIASVIREAARVSFELGMDDQAIDELMKRPGYLARRDIDVWLRSSPRGSEEVAQLLQLLTHPLLHAAVTGPWPSLLARIRGLALGGSQELALRNARHVASEQERHKAFFDRVEATPLTDEQRQAALICEDRCLVVAAAGSGKTSTIVAKVGYALAAGHHAARDILAVAFNKSAGDELRERLIKRLSGRSSDIEELTAQTFHKIGLNIIAAVAGKKPDLAPWANETPDNEGAIINELVADLCASNLVFLVRWNLFRALAAKPNKELPRFESRKDYDEYLTEVGEDRDGHKGIRTMNGELVRSMEEVAIANWLFLNGVPYEYERVYEYDTADKQHRQYHPDFYYPQIDSYHEHFALGADGRPPSFMSDDYAAGVEWKRALHAAKASR